MSIRISGVVFDAALAMHDETASRQWDEWEEVMMGKWSRDRDKHRRDC